MAFQGGGHRVHTMLTRALVAQTMSGRQDVHRVMPRKRETSIMLTEVTTGSKDTMERQGVWSLLWLTRVEI